MENNEIFAFTPDALAELPSLAAEREHETYLDELRKHSQTSIRCARVCSRLLDHRLPLPWDQDGPLSLVFPMVRTKRLLLGKCAMLGIPEPAAEDIWDIHRLCLGSFLPPAEMDDPGLHRILNPFEPYRGHLAAKKLNRLTDPGRSDSYLQALQNAEAPAEVKQDIQKIVAGFAGLARTTAADDRFAGALLAMVGLD